MRVLLIKPPWASLTTGTASFPIGLAYLAGALKRLPADVVEEVGVFNADFWEGRRPVDEYVFIEGEQVPDAEERAYGLLRRVIEEFRPDLVGMTLMTPEYENGKKCMALIREAAPGVPVAVGGVHVTLLPGETLIGLGADFAVPGEGERAMTDLVADLTGGGDGCGIPGVWVREGSSAIPPLTMPEPLAMDDLPLPDYGSVINPHAQHYNKAIIATARGCPGKCTYCATKNLWPGKVRFSSVERVMAEVHRLRDEHNVREVRFVDDTFTASRKRILALCDELEKMPDFFWSADTQARLVDGPLLERMMRAGCLQLNMGVESGSPPIREAIRKPGTLEETMAAVDMADSMGLGVVAYFMIGFPGETEADIEKTYDLLTTIKAYPIVSLLTPYPGTALYKAAEDRLKGLNVSWSELFHHSRFPLNLTEVEPEPWLAIQRRFHDTVKRLSAAYDMAARKELLRARRREAAHG
jgi:radical SAM superfamily enzyme YgiQ (UPF0313 family)